MHMKVSIFHLRTLRQVALKFSSQFLFIFILRQRTEESIIYLKKKVYLNLSLLLFIIKL